MSDKKQKRSARILDLLSQDKKMETSLLAEKTGVSQVTMRKDLDELESRGIIRREHGYAVLNNPENIAGRLAYHYDEKRKIALKAAELVSDNDTVMIESGSCCALLASELASTRKNITIVTNSAFIADHIRKETSVNIVLLGGIYQKDSQCLVGPMISLGASGYHVKYFFIGTDGWSPQTGFTNRDQMRAQAVRDMAVSCDNITILTESEKFSRVGTVPMNTSGHSQIVITDSSIPETARETLEQNGAKVILV
jgi:DeoR/GlpR family transcriptional regulator of sugar metabolism